MTIKKYSKEYISALKTELEETKKKMKEGEKRISEIDQINKKILVILESNKTPYEKKITLFNLVKDFEVGKMPLEKKKRTDYILQAYLHADLSKKYFDDYKKITAEMFSKSKTE